MPLKARTIGEVSRERDLMDDRRQKSQMELAFMAKRASETRRSPQGTESFAGKRGTERPAAVEALMEEVVERENLKKALQRVKSNKGSAGVDGMTVEQLPAYLTAHWPYLRRTLLDGTYTPQPVRRVEIPKPDGGVRKLGIPTVRDRFVQQALLQVLQERFDPRFSKHSHGFRPNHSARGAVAEAQGYVAEGYVWVVDIDLEKFFDRVNHDRLMARVAYVIHDPRVLKVLWAFLTAGVLENGLVGAIDEGTPQGGPLSPLLSNIVLDELDRELERRGHRFVRYADDCNVYVRSERAGERVMASIGSFITGKLKLTLNSSKSAVARSETRKFLGFTFWTRSERVLRAISQKALERAKAKIRRLTRRKRGEALETIVAELTVYLRGWRGYYGYCETPSALRNLDSWIRRRLRCLVWKRWKHGKARFRELVRRGVHPVLAAKTAGSAQGPWPLSKSPALSKALPNTYFTSLGLFTLAPR